MAQDPDSPASARRRETNTQATRGALMGAARAVFARDGFTGASLDDIVAAAGVTTGALYHHFGNKQGLFRAVAESIEQEILDRIVVRLDPSAPAWDQLEAGFAITLESCAQPDVRRIIFTDAPNVVGLRAWREIELRYGFGLMLQRLAALEGEGVKLVGSLELNAQILLGALIEAAHAIALAPDPTQALEEAGATLLRFLRSLRA